jgi:signal transduction histidine kinase
MYSGQINQLENNMAAAISHELKNSITSVRGLLKILKKDNRNSNDYYDLMIAELDRAVLMVKDYIDVVRKEPVNLKLYDLNNIIEELYPLIQAEAIQKNKNIKLNLQNIPNIYINNRDIHKLVINIANNGLESMEPGGELIIETYQENNAVVLMVQDQGNGIDPQVLEQLGTPFLTTKEGGTGLGLLICLDIIARQNANLIVKTGSKGTKFFVYFPIS